MQGVQVAQLLIPSPQGERKCHYIAFRCKKLYFFFQCIFFCFIQHKGISTQTILTIPVSQQLNSNEQLAQTLAALNNCPTNQPVHPHQKQQQQSSHQMPNLLASPSLLAQQSPQPPKPQQGNVQTIIFLLFCTFSQVQCKRDNMVFASTYSHCGIYQSQYRVPSDSKLVNKVQ